FLGYFIRPGVLRVSRGTFARFAERISQLYELGVDYLRIGEYVMRWFKWAKSGIRGTDNILLNSACPSLNKRPLRGK
ncbi:hypothetical protein, partial [Oceanicoccus sp.]|uniref:hypothetical protein n=1 Tax=Oceanicoccus sp. TaxID=2691044 RepID=UPI0026133F93